MKKTPLYAYRNALERVILTIALLVALFFSMSFPTSRTELIQFFSWKAPWILLFQLANSAVTALMMSLYRSTERQPASQMIRLARLLAGGNRFRTWRGSVSALISIALFSFAGYWSYLAGLFVLGACFDLPLAARIGVGIIAFMPCLAWVSEILVGHWLLIKYWVSATSEQLDMKEVTA